MEALSERIRKIRETLKIKQIVICQNMGITQQGYSHFECGNNPNFESLEKFCQVVGIELSFLVSDTPITVEKLEKYSKRKLSELITETENLEKIAYTFEVLVNSKNVPFMKKNPLDA